MTKAAELRVYLLVRDLRRAGQAILDGLGAAPGVTLVDVSMIGAAGRIYLSGPAAEVRRAQREITEVLSVVAGRDE